MKKLMIFIAIAIVAFGTVQAQEFRLGAKAGVNFATIGGDNAENLDPRISFHIGGLVEIPLIGKFAIQPELLYSSQGTKQGYYDFVFGNIKSNTKLDYINVPIMGKYYIIEKLSVELGPQIGFLVSAKNKYEDHGESGVIDEKDFYKSVDFAMGIGASYRLNNGVFFSLRFNKGISNINDTKYDYSLIEDGDPIDGNDFDIKNSNNVLQISAGYSF